MLTRILKKFDKLFIKIAVSLILFTFINVGNATIMTGNSHGNVTLEEFFDYTCPHCQAMSSVIKQLMANNPQLRVVYRPIPLLGSKAWFAAKSALAAQRQNKFIILHNALLSAREPLTQEAILNIANNSGINTRRLLSDMKNPVVEQTLRENLQAAHNIKLHYLPTIIISANSAKTPTVLYGEIPLAKLQAVVNEMTSDSIKK